MICDEENMILAFLNCNPEAFYAGGEICRKAAFSGEEISALPAKFGVMKVALRS